MSSMEQTAPATSIAQDVSAPVASISIIIPALNEEKMIGRCLESLTRLAFARDRFEVLIVDNGSRDRTLAIAESFKDRLNLKVLQQAGVRISALRNLGARPQRAIFLLFLMQIVWHRQTGSIVSLPWRPRMAQAFWAHIICFRKIHPGWEERGIAIRKLPSPAKCHMFLPASDYAS